MLEQLGDSKPSPAGTHSGLGCCSSGYSQAWLCACMVGL